MKKKLTIYKIKNREKTETKGVGMGTVRIKGKFDETLWGMMKSEECGALQSRKKNKGEKVVHNFARIDHELYSL